MNGAKTFLVRLLAEKSGQDLVEFALLAGFLAVAAGALLPPVAEDISVIFSKLGSVIASTP